MLKQNVQLVVITNYFPNSEFPQRSVFVKNLLNAMHGFGTPIVISPQPWVPPWLRGGSWDRLKRIAAREEISGIQVIHPRYIVVPKMDFLSGMTYWLAVIPHLLKLKRKFRRLLVHIHCAYPDGVGASLAARGMGIPYVLTAHGSDINVYAQKAEIRWQVAAALRKAAAVIGVSKPLVDKMTGIFAGRSYDTIPCAGYDPAVFFPREQLACRKALGLQERGRVVIFIGNLLPIKALEVLLTAWNTHMKGVDSATDDRLFIIGEGPLRDKLERLMTELGVESSVSFAGSRPHDEIPLWLGAADLLSLQSYNEGMPNVIVEALASGRPVVATNVGGIPYIMAASGLKIVPVGDSEALARALGYTLSRQWSQAELCELVRDYTWSALADRNVAVLNRVLGSLK